MDVEHFAGDGAKGGTLEGGADAPLWEGLGDGLAALGAGGAGVDAVERVAAALAEQIVWGGVSGRVRRPGHGV